MAGSTLARELTLVLAAKLIFLGGLWLLFFGPSNRPPAGPLEVGAVIAGPSVAAAPAQQSNRRPRSHP